MNASTLDTLAQLQALIAEYLQLAADHHVQPPPDLVHLQRLLDLILVDDHLQHAILTRLAQDYFLAQRPWKGTHAPALATARSAAPEAYEATVFEAAATCLEAIVVAANAYLAGYEKHQSELTDETRPNYQKYYERTQADLDPKKAGSWYRLQASVEQIAWVKAFEHYYHRHKAYVQAWKTRVRPNLSAQLIDEKDIQSVQETVANYEHLYRLALKPPEETAGIDPSHYVAVFEAGTWQKRLLAIKRARERIEAKSTYEWVDGNPPLEKSGVKHLSYASPPTEKPLYKKGKGDAHPIAPNDVQQGNLDDCYVLAPLAALAQVQPEAIKAAIEERKDGSFNVTLYLRTDPDSLERTKTVIHVKNEFPVRKGKLAYAGEGDGELWVQVMEKAYAQAMGGYEFINKGDEREVMEVLTGRKATGGVLDITRKEELKKLLLEARVGGALVTVSSRDNVRDISPAELRITNSHVYMLEKANNKEVILRNPHGVFHLSLKWDFLFKYFSDYDILE